MDSWDGKEGAAQKRVKQGTLLIFLVLAFLAILSYRVAREESAKVDSAVDFFIKDLKLEGVTALHATILFFSSLALFLKRDVFFEKKIWKINAAFLVIILLAALLRTIFLDRIPLGFYQDEAIIGYDAYSILLTGRDSHGIRFPVILTGFFDYRGSVLTYATIPFVFLFDLTIFSTRLASAVCGILTVALTYFLAKELFNEIVGILSSFFMAVSLWHITHSRIAFGVSLPLFIVLGVYLLYSGLKGHGSKRKIVSGFISLGLSFYTDATAKLFTPLLLLGFVIIFWRDVLKSKREFLCGSVLFLLVIAPLAYLFVTQYEKVQSRFNSVSIFSEGKTTRELLVKFLSNMRAHMSLKFLFLNGDSNIRHHPHGFGQLYLFDLPLMVLGIVYALKERRREQIFLLFWLLIYPIPASFTSSGVPHATRSIAALPVFQIISAYALFKLLKRAERSTLVSFIAFLFVFYSMLAVYSFLHHYFFVYPTYSAFYFSYGMKEVVEYIGSVEDRYDGVFLTHRILEPYVHILFYKKYDPGLFQSENKSFGGLWTTVNHFGRYWFGPTTQFYSSDKKWLYVVKPDELRSVPSSKNIFYPDGRIAYRIVEGKGCPLEEKGVYYLADLEPVSSRQGYGVLTKDRSVVNRSLFVNGVFFCRGLGTHSRSEVVYNISSLGASRFVSFVGVDDEVRYGSVVFEVYGDGKKLYGSRLLKKGDGADRVNVSVEGVSILKLVVTDGKDRGGYGDHADWGDAKLTRI